MNLPILIEPLVARPGYRARLGTPFDLTTEAPSAEAAVRQLTQALTDLLRSGAVIGTIPMPTLSRGGWLPDDELTGEWLRAVQDYRDECDKADRERLAADGGDGKVAS